MENQVCISLQLQEDQPAKSFTTQVVSLTSWDLFILVYMQEQNFKTSYKKTWQILSEIVSNCTCSKVLRIHTGKKAPSNKTPALEKSMNMDIWVAGISNQLFITGSCTETKFSKK